MKKNVRKRLCIIVPGHWSRIMGGSQYQAKCLIEELNKTERFDISFLTRDYNPGYVANGYELISYKYPGVHTRGAHRHLIEMFLLPRILKRLKPDIIYQRVGCSQTGVAARYALKNHCRMVWHIASEHDLKNSWLSLTRLFVDRFIDRCLLNYGIKNATHIVAQTEDQNRLLEQNYHRRATAVIPNFHQPPKEEIIKADPIKIVWVSNLKDLKQPEIFIRLARELQNEPNVQFLMVGNLQGPERAKRRYRQQIAQARSLQYLGPKSQDEVNTILSQSHIFVNTSRWEGFPNTFIQAWMRQVPVVSLTVDPDRLIAQKRLGFVSRSFENLKNNVSKLIYDQRLRTELGSNAQRFALQYFSIKNAEKIAQILDESF